MMSDRWEMIKLRLSLESNHGVSVVLCNSLFVVLVCRCEARRRSMTMVKFKRVHVDGLRPSPAEHEW
jgi:hypothetical protein